METTDGAERIIDVEELGSDLSRIEEKWDLDKLYADFSMLTPREMQILHKILNGCTLKQTADILGVQGVIVRKYFSNILRKINNVDQSQGKSLNSFTKYLESNYLKTDKTQQKIEIVFSVTGDINNIDLEKIRKILDFLKKETNEDSISLIDIIEG